MNKPVVLITGALTGIGRAAAVKEHPMKNYIHKNYFGPWALITGSRGDSPPKLKVNK